MVTAVKDAWGHIDILVNAAGIVNNVCAQDMTVENWEKVVRVDLTGTFLTNTAVGREMIRQKSGSIINISSMSAIISNCPQPQCHYNAAKAGVSMLTKSLAAEWAPHNVRVNALAPGYMKTELVIPVLDRYLEHWLPRLPMGRVDEPWEIKGPVVFLASQASSYLTGAVIVMDGGYTCW
jgi:NAD(P)-dependent dehydrogenase (short-subunit alcohol dehydrogenase family)